MTEDQRELVEFIGRRFDAVDLRLDRIEGRLDGVEERLTRVEVIGEQTAVRIALVDEGRRSLQEQMERRFDSVDAEFAAVRAEMRGATGRLPARGAEPPPR